MLISPMAVRSIAATRESTGPASWMDLIGMEECRAWTVRQIASAFAINAPRVSWVVEPVEPVEELDAVELPLEGLLDLPPVTVPDLPDPPQLEKARAVARNVSAVRLVRRIEVFPPGWLVTRLRAMYPSRPRQ